MINPAFIWNIFTSSRADNYSGTPYTLGQAQAHLSQSTLGKQITWIQQSPLEYLSLLARSRSTSTTSTSASKSFDAAVLAHCLWYFSSPSTILSTFHSIKTHSKRLLVAEWSLTATHSSAQPHVLAALTQAALESHKPYSDSNIRTVLGPKRLTELASACGWELQSEILLQPKDWLLDGQ